MIPMLALPDNLKHTSPYLLLTLMALFFGGNTVAGRLAVGHISPYQLVFLRWLLVVAAVGYLLGMTKIRSTWMLVRQRAGWIIFMSMVGLTGFNTLFYIAAHKTSAVNLGILQGSIPVWVLAGTYLIHGSPVRWVQLIGVLMTTIGVGVLATRADWGNLVALVGLNEGDLMMLLACFMYAIYTLGLKRRPPAVGGLEFFFMLACAALLTSAPLMLVEWLGGEAELPTLQGWLVLLFVAIFPSCLSHIFYIRGVEILGPARAGVFLNLVPIFAALCAIVIIAEPLHRYQAAALLLVLIGIALSEKSARAPAG